MNSITIRDRQEAPHCCQWSMELKIELDTRLTVSCAVAVALAYSLVTVLVALNSILLAFDNTVILLFIQFVLFGWRELLDKLGKIDR